LPRGIEPGDRPGEYRNVKDGSLLVFVPAGSFTMGSDEAEREMAILRASHKIAFDMPPLGAHPVELSAYYIGKLEVTLEQFGRFVRESRPRYVTEAERGGGGSVYAPDGRSWVDPVPRASWERPDGNLSDDRPDPKEPVVQVTWDDASAYCEWAGLALPTEAQWERAALWDPKAGRSHRYAWGDDPPRDQPVANLRDLSFLARTNEEMPDPELRLNYGPYRDGFVMRAPVGSFPLGASPCRALDMIGNVFEWCRDGYDASFYKNGPRRDPLCESASDLRIQRGGGWCDRPIYSLGYVRTKFPRHRRTNDLGFRVALPARP
jgi:formylglycine-generating enzyme required for sulfatase activity